MSPPDPTPCDAIWAWDADPEAERLLLAARLRRHGLVRGLIALSVATLAATLAWWVVAGVAAAIGTLTLVLALASPLGGYRRLQGAVEGFAWLVGQGIGWLTLVPVFYLVVTPYGWLTRRGERDPLHRQFDDRKSYWTRREGPRPDGREHLY